MTEKNSMYIVPWLCTNACSSGCLHCGFASNSPSNDQIKTKEALEVIDEVHRSGATWLGLSGGEPLLRKDILDLIDHARDTGLNVCLITNGYLIESQVFDNLVRNEVRVSISIDGTEETNDAIRDEGGYAKAVSAMEKLSEEGLLDCLVTTLVDAGPDLTNVNEEDIRHVLDLARDYRARWVIFHGFIPFNRSGRQLALAPSPEQYEWAWNKLYDLGQEYKGKPEVNVYCPFFARVAKQRGMPDFQDWYKNFFLGRCFFAGKHLSIIEDGGVIPCSFNDRSNLGDVREKSLEVILDDWHSSELARKLRDKDNLKGKCGVCEYREICGGCRTRAEIYTGDLFGSDPACGYVPKVLREK